MFFRQNKQHKLTLLQYHFITSLPDEVQVYNKLKLLSTLQLQVTSYSTAMALPLLIELEPQESSWS
jgi:hypothetical protein